MDGVALSPVMLNLHEICNKAGDWLLGLSRKNARHPHLTEGGVRLKLKVNLSKTLIRFLRKKILFEVWD